MNKLSKPIIIAGPCSAESEEQLVSTAKGILATGKANIFRAGIWKPRTMPGGFEGVGSIGLKWMQTVKKETGLPLAVEVANNNHAEEALKHDIDVLWIGARSTVNPFTVQEIADALKGTDKIVLIKNPVNPDIKLWIGALERLQNSGVKQVGLIHRGFSIYGNTEYRNSPMWHLAIEMKRLYPNLWLINDPSHICGRTDTLLEVSQRSADLDFDGLMIETHIHPEKAWSDAQQQITPEHLNQLLESIIWRREDVPSESYHLALDKLRQQINHLDDELMQILSHRMKIAEEIGKYKKENNITILQTNRWNEILERAYREGDKRDLSREFVKKYMDAVHMESIHHQKKILDLTIA